MTNAVYLLSGLFIGWTMAVIHAVLAIFLVQRLLDLRPQDWWPLVRAIYWLTLLRRHGVSDLQMRLNGRELFVRSTDGDGNSQEPWTKL